MGKQFPIYLHYQHFPNTTCTKNYNLVDLIRQVNHLFNLIICPSIKKNQSNDESSLFKLSLFRIRDQLVLSLIISWIFCTLASPLPSHPFENYETSFMTQEVKLIELRFRMRRQYIGLLHLTVPRDSLSACRNHSVLTTWRKQVVEVVDVSTYLLITIVVLWSSLRQF